MDRMFECYAAHDRAAAAWLEDLGWPVTARHYDFDRDVFAWRHDAAGMTRTLRITRAAVEDNAPHILIAWLKTSRIDDAMAGAPDRHLIVRRSEGGGIVRDCFDVTPGGAT